MIVYTHNEHAYGWLHWCRNVKLEPMFHLSRSRHLKNTVSNIFHGLLIMAAAILIIYLNIFHALLCISQFQLVPVCVKPVLTINRLLTV